MDVFKSSFAEMFIAQDLSSQQGDQIGRIFAHWLIVYFGHFCAIWHILW
jgi:hypothetical protein